MRIGATQKAVYRGLTPRQIIAVKTNLEALTGFSLDELLEKCALADFRDDIAEMAVYSSWIAATTGNISSGNAPFQTGEELNAAASAILYNWLRGRQR